MNVLVSAQSDQHSTYYLYSKYNNFVKQVEILNPSLQVRELRFKGVKYFVHSHLVNKEKVVSFLDENYLQVQLR